MHNVRNTTLSAVNLMEGGIKQKEEKHQRSVNDCTVHRVINSIEFEKKLGN